MRIAHFLLGRCNPDSSNGIDKTVFYLSRAQAALGHNVTVVSITEKPAIPIPGVRVQTYAPTYRPLPIPAGRFKDLLHHRSPLNLPRTLVTDLFVWEPEIVHFHFVHIPQAIRIARMLRRRGIPYCVSLHGGLAPEAQRRRRFGKKLFAIVIERRYLERAAFLHAVSSTDVDGATAYGVENRSVLAPNGIDPALLPQDIDADVVRRRFPELDGRRIFLYLGRLDPEQKGLDLLLRAWSRLPPRDGAALLLVGPNWRGTASRLRDLAITAEADNIIVFAGVASGSDKWRFLAAADVFVHTSRWEAGVPFAVLEAMLAGKPLLLSHAADPLALVEQFSAGLRVAPDEQSILQGLVALAHAPRDHLLTYGSNARDLVVREFRWERTAEKLIRAYGAAITASSGPLRSLDRED